MARKGGTSSQGDELSQMLRRSITGMVRDDRPDFSMKEFAVLLVIYAGPMDVLTVSEIARKLNVSVPVVRRALAYLEDCELAIRVRSPEDNRSTLAGQTQEGRAYIGALKLSLDWSVSRERSGRGGEVDEREVCQVSGAHGVGGRNEDHESGEGWSIRNWTLP